MRKDVGLRNQRSDVRIVSGALASSVATPPPGPVAGPFEYKKPLAIDLFCGLGGWADGTLAEGWDVIGFDIERHDYGTGGYPGQLVIQDVLTLHGSQFKDAAVIVASPPCQTYSYMAMPWTRAKKIAAEYRAGIRSIEELNALFNACFRIAKEAGVPLIVENVRGAQPWVGSARWNFGSFYLWGDLPALMPIAFRGFKSSGMDWSDQSKRGQDFTRITARQRAERDGIKIPGNNSARMWTDREVQRLCAPIDGLKTVGHANMRDGHTHARHLTNQRESDAIKIGGDWFSDPNSTCRKHGSKSKGRKAASAQIAKIPLPLARHIAQVFKPAQVCGVEASHAL